MHLSIALGRRLALTRLQLYDPGMAALFHDIGKSRVPLDVINKADVLTDEEWRMIAAHPWLGVLALFSVRDQQGSPYRSMLVAFQHHMKRDLTGYPRSLRTKDLTFYSKIVAVADGFDAATSRRSYQTTPMAPSAVLQEMRDNARRGMDPVIVKAFINMLGIYPVGTFLVLDTFELAIVHAASADPDMLSRPVVRIVSDDLGNVQYPGEWSTSPNATSPATSAGPSSRPRTPIATVFASATTSSETAVLTARFDALRTQGRRALVCYATAGHPDPEGSIALWQGLEAAGADVLEVGVPFSDPMADGPVIEASSQVALSHGVHSDGALGLVSRARLGIPMVLFSYLNPLIAAGPAVLQRAADAGVHGVLVTDLPVGSDPAREAWLGGGTARPRAPRRAHHAPRPHGEHRAARARFRLSHLAPRRHRRERGTSSRPAPDHRHAALGLHVAHLRRVRHFQPPTRARAVGALADGIVVGARSSGPPASPCGRP